MTPARAVEMDFHQVDVDLDAGVPGILGLRPRIYKNSRVLSGHAGLGAIS